MADTQRIDALLRLHSVNERPIEEALNLIAELINLSGDARRTDGCEHALKLLKSLPIDDLDPLLQAHVHYFTANAHASLHAARRTDLDAQWSWDLPETAQEILALRGALKCSEFEFAPPPLRAMVHTNLGNALNMVGRNSEAQREWAAALAAVPTFAMALGNSGLGLKHLAAAVYDPGHAGMLARRALLLAERANQADAVWDAEESRVNGAHFLEITRQAAAYFDPEAVAETIDLDAWSLGRSSRERDYRTWCLEHTLFLNPLNEIGPLAIAANDVLTAPSHVASLDAPPTFVTAYNVMKQEYCGARLFLFEATESKQHFADRDVLLYDTFDHATYSIALERARTAYRLAFSILDKIAHFLNAYFELGRAADRGLSLRNVWGPPGSTERLLLEQYRNWPLRGLYFLSMDIRGNPKDLATDPEARELADLRHALEHRFVVIHDMLLGVEPGDSARGSIVRVERSAFERHVLSMLQLTRSALTYLSLAMHEEERRRASERKDPEGPTIQAPFFLRPIPDRDKR